MSSNEAGFDLREIRPLSRDNILHSWELRSPAYTGQRTNLKGVECPTGCRSWLVLPASPKVPTANLIYSVGVRDTAKSGIGHIDNRHLNDLGESISVNVGGAYRDAKASSLPMPGRSVGGFRVLGGRESRLHGDGSQGVNVSQSRNVIASPMNFGRSER